MCSDFVNVKDNKFDSYVATYKDNCVILNKVTVDGVVEVYKFASNEKKPSVERLINKVVKSKDIVKTMGNVANEFWVDQEVRAEFWSAYKKKNEMLTSHCPIKHRTALSIYFDCEKNAIEQYFDNVDKKMKKIDKNKHNDGKLA